MAEKYVSPHPPHAISLSATWRAEDLSRRFFRFSWASLLRESLGEESDEKREREGTSGAESFSAQLLFGGSL